jgi:hypothetical protein
MTTDLEARVCGIPCTIRVSNWDTYQSAKVHGPPEDCCPAEGGSGDWEILDLKRRPAPWLSKKLATSPDEQSRLEQFIFDQMENHYGNR